MSASDFPWARVDESDLGVAMPIVYPKGPFKRYRVAAAKTFLYSGRGRLSKVHSDLLGDDGIARGTVVDGDGECWSSSEAGLFVHVVHTNPVLSGAILGWCPFADLQPLTDAGEALPRVSSITVEEAAGIQKNYMEGYSSLGTQIAIRD
eukprot:2127398-Prymnesium_polylepis.1